MKQQLDYTEQQLRDYQNREQQYLRQIEEHNSQSAQVMLFLWQGDLAFGIKAFVYGK